jgi:regulator of protease activity HflC (stomatin/prohibitin superfamily)
MLGFRYLKAPATTFVLHYKNGQVVRRGTGLSFVYFAPTSILVQVPATSIDMPFGFTETSADFQETTVQGNLTYRIVDPERLAALLDYTVDQNGRYKSDDPSKVGERLIQTTQTAARSFIQSQKLRALLTSSAQLIAAIREAMQLSTTVQQLGVEVLTDRATASGPRMSRSSWRAFGSLASKLK